MAVAPAALGTPVPFQPGEVLELQFPLMPDQVDCAESGGVRARRCHLTF